MLGLFKRVCLHMHVSVCSFTSSFEEQMCTKGYKHEKILQSRDILACPRVCKGMMFVGFRCSLCMCVWTSVSEGKIKTLFRNWLKHTNDIKKVVKKNIERSNCYTKSNMFYILALTSNK